MKGETKITIKIKDETGSFSKTETFIIKRDSTFEGIDDWIEVFKKILYCVSFQEETVNDAFGE